MTERLSLLFESQKGASIYNNALRIIKECSMDKMLSGGALVGFSGGPDSVMLLCVLKKYFDENSLGGLLALHVNHMIRGAEADRDEQFSRDFCASLGVEFISVKRDVPSIVRLSSQGVEEAARNVRYSVFDEIIRGRNDLSCVAVAHNSTDNLETVILNMMRGAGTRGMSGIPPIRDNVVRPLLYSSKREILEALDQIGIPYVIDSTNLENNYKRNYVRNELLPRLKRLSDDPEDVALRLSKNLRSDADYIDSAALNFVDSHRGDSIPLEDMRELHAALLSRVIRIMAKGAGATSVEAVHVSKIAELLHSSNSFEVSLPGGVCFACRGGVCFVGTPTLESREYDRVLSLGENYIPEIDAFIILSETPNAICSSNVYKISIKTSIDFDIINGDVHVRNKRDGDAYVYGGMTRKLKKLFNDRSIPPELRSRIPVFYDGSGILWVKGFSARDGGAKKPLKQLYISIHEKEA